MVYYLINKWYIYPFSSVAQSCPTLCDPMDCSMPGFPVHHQLLELAQAHVHWVSQWCHPTISPSVAPFSLAFSLFQHQGIFQWAGFSYQVAKVKLQLQHSIFIPSNEYSGLISFRIDGFDLLVVQGTLKHMIVNQNFRNEDLVEIKRCLFGVYLDYSPGDTDFRNCVIPDCKMEETYKGK